MQLAPLVACVINHWVPKRPTSAVPGGSRPASRGGPAGLLLHTVVLVLVYFLFINCSFGYHNKHASP